jgi:hypothetical protein
LGCAATSTKASRTACEAPTSTPSTRSAHCPTPSRATVLPATLNRVAFRYRGRRLQVDIQHHHVTYRLLSGPPLAISYHGHRFQLAEQVTLSLPDSTRSPRLSPRQPAGRAPARGVFKGHI